MATRHKHPTHRSAALFAAALGIGTIGATSFPSAASAASSASFSNGVLSVFGDALDNNIAISRNAAGQILVSGGAIAVVGGTPTVANTRSISVFGLGGNDTLTLVETNGALPKASLFGGAGNDVLTGGSAADMVFGQAGNDTLLGKGGFDLLFGGADNDVITGGDADDQAFGEAGNDRLVWNPGDDTDLNEGGAGTDTIEVNGGNGAEQFTTTANGTRVRFDRVTPAPFSIDIGTSEALNVNANGGDDTFAATGNLAALIRITVDGGTGNDRLLGSNGIDTLAGGAGNDFVDGQQGNDTAFLGADNDTFQWDPGDGSDIVEGQDGVDTLVFNGANIAENFDVAANGGRVRFSRNIAAITMDLNDVEALVVNALGGADNLTVNDLTGTDLTSITSDLAASAGSGAGDGAADNVIVNATNADDVVVVGGSGASLQVVGLATAVTVTGAEPANDRVTVNALGGSDVVDASGVTAGSAMLTLNGGAADDVLIGGAGNDTLLGGEGDDVLIGGPGVDVLDGGAGDNVLIDGENVVSGQVAGQAWLDEHVTAVADTTVLEFSDNTVEVPAADLVQEVSTTG